MRGLIFKILPLVLLSSCGQPQGINSILVPEPHIITEKCVKKVDIPVRPSLLKEKTPTNLEQALSLSLAKIADWEQYGNKADEIMKGCSNDN